jgi:hypothetical protein
MYYGAEVDCTVLVPDFQVIKIRLLRHVYLFR